MAKVNLSGMSVEALMDLRERVEGRFLSVMPSFKNSWREWTGQLPPSVAEAVRVQAH